MSATMAIQPANETWRDWIPAGASCPDDSELITRDQLLDELRKVGFDVSVRNLMYWESKGVLPRPVRRWRDGAPRALYPHWMALVVRRMINLKQGGYSLRQVREMLRGVVRGEIPRPSHVGASSYDTEMRC